MEPLWHIEMLGWLRAVPRAGSGHCETARPVARFRSRRAAALLAYLALAHSAETRCQRPHPRELLIELLWPDAAGNAGRCSLRTELCWLRQRLEPSGVPAGAVLLTEGDTVRLNPAAYTTDVAAFEKALRSAATAGTGVERARWLTEAVGEYRGELLPGQFDPWVAPERLRLAEAFLQAVHQLVVEREAAGDRDGALRCAWQAVGVDPLREENHADLTRLLATNGRPEEVLSLYRERLLERVLSGVPDAGPASGSAARERALRQRLCVLTAETAELRRQLAVKAAEVEELNRRLAEERAEAGKLWEEAAARTAEAGVLPFRLAPADRELRWE
jgi:DNA-binding SARP family transcriptional activator